MQRLISLGLLIVVVGGGWSALKGLSPQRVQQAIRNVGNVVGQRAPSATYGAGAPPAFGQPAPAYQPQQQGGYFAPPPAAGPTPTIRIASFNIQTFGNTKASKPYVMDALARIVRQFDVVAIQEIRTQDDYFIPKFLRDYVNAGAPAGAPVYDGRVSERLGRTNSTEQYAFLFNTATVDIHPSFTFVVPDPQDLLHREPYVALFRTRVVEPYKPFTFTLINTHTDPDEVPQELDALYQVYRYVQRLQVAGAAEDDVILLGDFNTAVPSASRYTPNAQQRLLAPKDLRMLARIPGIAPLIQREATNTRGTRLHDNLLIPSRNTVEFTARSGVLDVRTELGYQLTLEQALQVSDHLPVWGEFNAIEGQVGQRIASRR